MQAFNNNTEDNKTINEKIEAKTVFHKRTLAFIVDSIGMDFSNYTSLVQVFLIMRMRM